MLQEARKGTRGALRPVRQLKRNANTFTVYGHNKIANIKSANCISETNSPNISLANKSSCMVTLLLIAI